MYVLYCYCILQSRIISFGFEPHEECLPVVQKGSMKDSELYIWLGYRLSHFL